MKKKSLGTAILALVVFGGIFLTISPSEASKPFFAFCYLHPTGVSSTAPDIFTLPDSKGKCPSSYAFAHENTPAALIADINTISKTMFQSGQRFANTQNTIRQFGRPCTMDQPGCHP